MGDDIEFRFKTLEEVWDNCVNDIQSSRATGGDNYLEGLLEGQMYFLSKLAVLMGRQQEYAELCMEVDEDLHWLFEG